MDDLKKRQHFLNKAEVVIRESNQEILNPLLSDLNDETVAAAARAVGLLRGRYLETALEIFQADGNKVPPSEALAMLATLRKDYDEARHAFEELMRTIERGYVNLPS